ncbi:MAG: hypothetical protein LH478_09915 [Chitinophagaceae bacterium]|nr:hypothetical protein [Chitinophagaceae bacterium]
MKWSIVSKLSAVVFFSAIIFIACTKENEEDLQPKINQPLCDTVNMMFTKDVLPIITLNCYSCHGNGQMQGGMNLDGYIRIKRQVDNNQLINVIRHSPGYAQMPQGQPKLAQCDIDKIEAWIRRGALNN